MPTANDLISRALRRAGILETGQTALANDSLEALDTLNDVLDQWSLEDLMIFYSTMESFALVDGTNSYSIGATGNFITVRPIELLKAKLLDSGGITYDLEVIDFSNYQDIIQKNPPSSTQPTVIAYQPSYPNGQLYLWQTPSSGWTLQLETNKQFIRIADLATEIDDSFPVGFVKAMVDTLAAELCIEYGHLEHLQLLQEAALISKMNIKRKNAKKTVMRIDGMFMPGGRRPGTYNPYSDT